MNFSVSRNCPKCGGNSVKLVSSRPQHNLMDPLGQQPPVSILRSYKCQCGFAFAEATPHAQKDSGDLENFYATLGSPVETTQR